MNNVAFNNSDKPVIAFGPEMPGFGSWEWVGADIAGELSEDFNVRVFGDEVPPCDVAVFVKFRPSDKILAEVARRSAVVFCPVDVYGSCAEIDADEPILSACTAVIVHCRRLVRYFSAYSRVEYVDHHLKYHAPLRDTFRSDGPILWIGVESNLPPLVDWVNRHKLREELWVLTNVTEGRTLSSPDAYGFNGLNRVRVEEWNRARRLAWTETARAALDIKGDVFRYRHKPPTKAMDFIASGVPLAMNADTSSAAHLAEMGFILATPDDRNWWLSRDYWEQTMGFGQRLRGELGLRQVGRRWKSLLEDILAEQTLKNFS